MALMRRVVQKSIITGLLSVWASLALSFSIVPVLGRQVAGAGLFMTIYCLLAISIPASALHFTQSERVPCAEAATAQALTKLAEAYDALRLQYRMDGLTGILTRSAFMEDLETTSQQGVPGTLLFLDLDYFKSINDRYGHAMGDEALRCAGRVLARYQGQSDSRDGLAAKNSVCFNAIWPSMKCSIVARRSERKSRVLSCKHLVVRKCRSLQAWRFLLPVGL
jgi:GGDEF domain-containing protein